jgi:glycosyltransferase involved in cell wall biosynthesis
MLRSVLTTLHAYRAAFFAYNSIPARDFVAVLPISRRPVPPVNRRLVLLVGGSASTTGGIERYCRRMLCALRQHTTYHVRWLKADTAVSRRRLTAFLCGLYARVVVLRHMLSRMDSARDVVWVQYANGVDLLLLALIRRWFKGTVFCTAHVGAEWFHLRSSILRRVAVILLGNADRVFCLSAVQHHAFGMAETRFVRIPTLLPDWVNGLDATGQRHQSGLVFFGRVDSRKGIYDLLHAFALVLRQHPGLRMDIAGTGPDETAARHLADALHLSASVTWHGSLSEPDLLRLIERRKVLVYPSRADAYPLAVLEAIALGLDVVLCDIPAAAEIVHTYGGWLVPVGNVRQLALAICQAHSNAPRIRRDTEILEFQWPEVARRYAEHIEAAYEAAAHA